MDSSIGIQGREGSTKSYADDSSFEQHRNDDEEHDFNTEPVDYENNGLLWLPPEPEYEEDDIECGWCHEYEEDDIESGSCHGHFSKDIVYANHFKVGYSERRDTSQNELERSEEEFPPIPSDNQSILVYLSTLCLWRGTVCDRHRLIRIEYYGNFDKPLGMFLQDTVFDQSYRCRSCDMPSEAHVQCYTHRQGTLTISVKKLPEILLPGGKDGKIWAWHRCLRCPRTNGFPPPTRRVVMSGAAWGLSFGKILELSFSNHAAESKVASCGHSVHRDCLQFYGCGELVACFGYASVDVYSFYLPPAEVDFNSEIQDRVLPEGYNQTNIPVYEDEPTSAISYALNSQEYHSQISEDAEALNSHEYNSQIFEDAERSKKPIECGFPLDESMLFSLDQRSPLIPDSLVTFKPPHVRVSFTDSGPLDKTYTVTCYYAKQFDALRNICCPSELDFIRSLSRCKKWEAPRGKSNVYFAKTLDDRFIIKQVTKTQLDSFMQSAAQYFKYLVHATTTNSPTCLAKILGIYQVTTNNLKGGKESKMDLLIMENILYRRNVSRVYDLKGSARYNPDCSGSNKVLLDLNLVETMATSPILVGIEEKRLMERAVWCDTSFLSAIDVMDYSLLVGVDEEKHELVIGIIAYMRQYTWNKRLETWVKSSDILCGPNNPSPTVIPPRDYKKRFRKSMSAYFIAAPGPST